MHGHVGHMPYPMSVAHRKSKFNLINSLMLNGVGAFSAALHQNVLRA